MKPTVRFFSILALTTALPAVAGDPPALVPVTTITVDTIADPEPDNANRTCENPGPTPGCSFRRALMQAATLTDGERPVAIEFNLPAGDENPQAPGTWTINVSSNDIIRANQGGAAITTSGIGSPNAQVIIDGATQPGGRTVGGPPVFINADSAIESNRKQIEIRNLGFYGGTSLFISGLPSGAQPRDNTEAIIENIWWGLDETGTEIQYLTVNTNNLAGPSAVVFNKTDFNVIRNSVITGSRGGAVDVTSGADDNLIEDNFIGTKADGTVPEPPPGLECLASFTFFPEKWYGGLGVKVTTSKGTIIRNNLIAGLDNVRAGSDTPPIAIDIGVTADSLVENNVIGLDSAMTPRGVCGGAIFESTTQAILSTEANEIRNNVIARSRIQFPETPESDAAIFLAGDRTVGTIVENNLVFDSTEAIIGFASSIPDAWENFASARVLVIDGTTISGTNGDASPCANCALEFFLDDDAPSDGKAEALQRLTTTTTDADGNWSIQLAEPLMEGEAVRVISRTTAFGQITGMTAGTTAAESRAYPYDFMFESTFSLTDSVN